MDYGGGREVSDFVEFLNGRAGTHRKEDGSLTDDAGRVPALDKLVSGATVDGSLVDKLTAEVEKLSGDAAVFGKRYVKAANRIIAKGAGYVAKEKARLERMIESGSVTAAKKTNFMLRRNVLLAFE